MAVRAIRAIRTVLVGLVVLLALVLLLSAVAKQVRHDKATNPSYGEIMEGGGDYRGAGPPGH